MGDTYRILTAKWSLKAGLLEKAEDGPDNQRKLKRTLRLGGIEPDLLCPLVRPDESQRPQIRLRDGDRRMSECLLYLVYVVLGFVELHRERVAQIVDGITSLELSG